MKARYYRQTLVEGYFTQAEDSFFAFSGRTRFNEPMKKTAAPAFRSPLS